MNRALLIAALFACAPNTALAQERIATATLDDAAADVAQAVCDCLELPILDAGLEDTPRYATLFGLSACDPTRVCGALADELESAQAEGDRFAQAQLIAGMKAAQCLGTASWTDPDPLCEAPERVTPPNSLSTCFARALPAGAPPVAVGKVTVSTQGDGIDSRRRDAGYTTGKVSFSCGGGEEVGLGGEVMFRVEIDFQAIREATEPPPGGGPHLLSHRATDLRGR